MSLFLIITLLLFTAGAGITFFLTKKRHEFADLTGACIFILVTILWVIAGRQLPLIVEFGGSQTLLGSKVWSYQIDSGVWQITLVTLVLGTTISLASDLWSRFLKDLAGSRDRRPLLITPFAFLFALSANLAIWSSSIISIIQSWTLFIILWTIFYWLNNIDRNKIRSAVSHSIVLLMSVLLIWLSYAANGEATSKISDVQNWSLEAVNWAVLAASILVGLFLLHWWRPLDGQLPAAAGVLLHLFPTLVGGWLLIRISPGFGSVGPLRTIITTVALLGLLGGAVLSWGQVKNPRKLVPSLILAMVNLVAISALWLDFEAARNELIALVLALAGLLLFNAWPGQKAYWHRIAALVYAATLAGIPLTLSFGSRAELFQVWFEGGQVFLAVGTSLLLAANIGIAILIVRGIVEVDLHSTDDRRDSIQFGAVLFILALGLINLAHLDRLLDNWIALMFILISGFGGFLLNRSSQRIYEIEENIRKALPTKQIPYLMIGETVTRFLSNIETIIREGAAILEGEGGMLWLVVMLIILWLARVSQ